VLEIFAIALAEKRRKKAKFRKIAKVEVRVSW